MMGNNIYSVASRSIKMAKQRVFMSVSVFLLLFSLLIVRLVHIMIINGNQRDKFFDSLPPIISRSDIIDRNGNIIATSLPTVSLFACPHEIMDLNEATHKLMEVFPDLDEKNIREKLSSAKKFVWMRRHLSPKKEQLVLNQGIPGLHFLKTEKRVYPDKNLLSHVIGGTDVDNIGIAGIEKVFDEMLKSQNNPLILSIDMKVQHAVHDELQKSLQEFNALGGAALVMKISTGEIISMVSLPDFDPNKNSNPTDKEHFNMAVSSAVEPGSSAKIFNTVMALETGKITPFSKFDARYPIKIGKFTIHDFRGEARFLSVEEILKYSSNIGSAKIALEVGATAQKQFFKKIGLLDPIYCELSESQHPIYPRQWNGVSAMTISFGHGIALSPLHLVSIFSGLLNDGLLAPPTLLKKERALSEKAIISPKVSCQLRALLRINVTEGKNKFADVPGYCVGGKSGTAEKLQKGHYVKNANYCGFIGAFPMTNPLYAVYVLLDEPKASAKTSGYATAGWNAAPTAAKIIRRIGPILGVMAISAEEPDWKKILKTPYNPTN
ncbi:MAG: penicillin-binding protein 2 [Holosporaceae bacterium]|jgi:cell division protein FtsI (penicillin-binding protein 3)|nr:penicillin-binding protein 2 [Holosporaceae bacterium]